MTDWPDEEEEPNSNNVFTGYNPYKPVPKPNLDLIVKKEPIPMKPVESWETGPFNGLKELLDNLGVKNLIDAVEQHKRDLK